jgi:hypothetical protein
MFLIYFYIFYKPIYAVFGKFLSAKTFSALKIVLKTVSPKALQLLYLINQAID